MISFGPTFKEITGWSHTECVNRPFTSFIHPDDLFRVREVLRKSPEVPVFQNRVRFLSKYGKYLIIKRLILIPQIEKGQLATILGIAGDIVDYKLTKQILKEKEEKLRNIFDFFDFFPDAVLITDLNGKIVECNRAALNICRYPSKNELIGQNILSFIARKNKKMVIEGMEKCLKEGFVKDIEYILITRDGDEVPAEFSASTIKDEFNIPIGFIIDIKDMIKHKQKENRLTYMATHDVLTGLPNRALFNDRFSLALHQAKRDRSKLYLMILDLDKFKGVNDKFGHEVEDKLLQEVAARLVNFLRKSDTVARLGGDEFALILPKILSKEDAMKVVHKILQAMRQPFIISEYKINISVSVGVAIYPDNSENAQLLIRCADAAMYQAKQKGRDTYQFFTSPY